VLFGVLLGAVQLVGSLAVAPLQPDRPAPDVPLAVALLVAGPVAFALTRRPVARAAVSTACAAAYLGIGYPVGPGLLAAVLALVLAVVAGQQGEAWLVGAAGLTGALAASRLGEHPLPAPGVLQSTGWAVAVLAVAEVVRARREVAEVWGRARAQTRLREARERHLRVARDIQDDVAHRIHVANARVAVALPLLHRAPPAPRAPAPGYVPGPAPGYVPGPAPGYVPGLAPGYLPADGVRRGRGEELRAPLDGALRGIGAARGGPAGVPAVHGEVRSALMAVRELGDEALAGLRRVTEVLAAQGGVPDEAMAWSQVPGLAGLTALAEQWALAGVLVRAAGDPGVLPAAADQVAYRVIREALVNVARHSCATHADLALHRDGDQLTVLVSDPGPPRAVDLRPPAPDGVEWDSVLAPGEWDSARAAGRGLIRIRERVEALGGALSAGPDGTGWCVHVVLPAGPPEAGHDQVSTTIRCPSIASATRG
jgi:signal transduction histidine kinase